MSNPFLQSAQQNSIYQGLLKNFTSSLSSYSWGASAIHPPISKHWISVQPKQGISANNFTRVLSFDIPKNGFISSMMIQNNLTLADAANGPFGELHPVGYYMYSQITLNQGSNIIYEQTPASILLENKRMSAGTSLFFQRAARLTNPATRLPISANITTPECYTPLLFSSNDNPMMALDTSKLSDLELRCTTNVRALVQGITGNADVTISPVLWIEYFQIDQKYYDTMKSEGLKNKFISIPIDSYLTETFNNIPNNVVQNLVLRSNALVSALYVDWRTSGGVRRRVISGSLTVNGLEQIPRDTPRVLLDYDSSVNNFGGGCFVSSSNIGALATVSIENELDPLVIDFGLQPLSNYKNNHSEIGSMVSLRGVSNPTLRITSTAADATDVIQVVLKIKQMLIISDDGSITVFSSA